MKKTMLNFKLKYLVIALSFSIGTANAQIQDGVALLEIVKTKIKQVDTQQLQAIAKNDSDTVYIDVRTPEEVDAQGGAMDFPRVFNIERGWLEYQVPERVTKQDTPIIVFCGTNQRSPFATQTLINMGYSNVKNYADGFIHWRNAGLPIKGDNSPNSMLYRLPQEVIPGVWSAIGATAPSTYFNSGHNNNLSFIITKEGVVVVNAGDNYLLAKALHDEIKKVTNQQVKYVILENGQGHAMLGSNYWQEQGAKIVAHVETAAEIKVHGSRILAASKRGRRDKMAGTKVVAPDITFETQHVIELGGERIEVIRLGPAHSPGDVVTWMPNKKLVISGDVAFHQRLLPVMEDTDTDAWIGTWDKFLALKATVVIPGHGNPTTYAQVTKYTHDYLQFMRDQIDEIIDAGGELQEAYNIDQSEYSHLDTFFELSRQNAGRMYREMEFEF
ncbi:MAG: glyoxylase-like metal-dependent hydrolase (beta-lactamase superfamily II) [Arenicella sp.]|jgi:glyoxylase-like metal-dependent hydrolase (beta-lactamase superfamily II)/rhodanese-related sulfurtransferase